MVTINLEEGWVCFGNPDINVKYALGSPEGFEIVSDVWLRASWDTKYVYSFTWLGRPIIQLPDDMLRIQEVIFSIKPDVIIETGVAHGGSLIFYASLFKAMGKGKVVGVDIEIRPHNRKAIEDHFLFDYITLIEGNSIDHRILDQVKGHINPGDTVMVCLDACHTKEHVLNELNFYSPLVTQGSYIVAMDGIMGRLGNAPRTEPNWIWNNPTIAAQEFCNKNPNFKIVEPSFLFNEGICKKRVTYWPGAFIQRQD
jgi:cephalosporin hydroxylase